MTYYKTGHWPVEHEWQRRVSPQGPPHACFVLGEWRGLWAVGQGQDRAARWQHWMIAGLKATLPLDIRLDTSKKYISTSVLPLRLWGSAVKQLAHHDQHAPTTSSTKPIFPVSVPLMSCFCSHPCHHVPVSRAQPQALDWPLISTLPSLPELILL